MPLYRSESLQKLFIAAVEGVDGQGKPTYAEEEEVEGRVVWEDEVVRGTSEVGGTGEEVMTVAKVWVGAEQPLTPSHGDRIRTEAGPIGVVVFKKEVRELQYGQLRHVRVSMARE